MFIFSLLCTCDGLGGDGGGCGCGRRGAGSSVSRIVDIVHLSTVFDYTVKCSLHIDYACSEIQRVDRYREGNALGDMYLKGRRILFCLATI